jgi:hypothetical protein
MTSPLLLQATDDTSWAIKTVIVNEEDPPLPSFLCFGRELLETVPV